MKPTDFSTPILVVPAITAPLTTLTTMSTEITSVSRPNAMMNGTHGAMALCSDCRASSQDAVPASAPAGSAARSVATSALIAAAVPAPENWYSICACPEPPVLAPAAVASAGLGPPGEHALISLLALNGLRVSEATGADIEHLRSRPAPRGERPFRPWQSRRLCKTRAGQRRL